MLAAMIVALTGASVLEVGAAKPNILIIVGDDMGYADVGCFGAKGIATPHLDPSAETPPLASKWEEPA